VHWHVVRGSDFFLPDIDDDQGLWNMISDCRATRSPVCCPIEEVRELKIMSVKDALTTQSSTLIGVASHCGNLIFIF
jgi:hypothetical protein